MSLVEKKSKTNKTAENLQTEAMHQSHENTYICRNNTHYTCLLHMVTHNITYDNII